MAPKRSALRRRLRRWRPRLRLSRPALPLAGAVGVGTLLAFAPVAAAAGHWDPPRSLSQGRSSPLSLAATAGLDAKGDGAVLWHSQRGVEAVLHAAGRGFDSPRPIPGSVLSMPDLRPRLAFDARGAALAVWSYFEPHPRFVQAGYAVDYTFGLRVASRTPHGVFGRAQTLTGKLDADPSADIAMNPDGTAVVVWTDEAGMHAAARPAGKRRFEHAQVISQTQADPQVGVGARGSAAAWTSQRGHAWRVGAASADSGADFGRASNLPIRGLGKAKPVVAVDGRSTVTAAWANRGRVMAALCSAAGNCGPPRALSPAGQTASDPRVAVAADGSAVVAWRSPEGVAASLRRGHGAFARAATLTSLKPGASATGLAVGIGPRGDAAAVWTVHGPEGDQVVAAMRHGAGHFAHAYSLTAKVPGAAWSDPQVVLSPSGAALAVWGSMVDGHPSVQAAAYSR